MTAFVKRYYSKYRKLYNLRAKRHISHYHMKKTLLLSALLFGSMSASFAQKKGILGKINEKIESINTAAAESAKNTDTKEIAKDMEDPLLDSKPVNKDSKGISGIYFSHVPIKIGHKGLYEFNYSRKFLLNYTENPDQHNTLEIISRHHFDKSKELPRYILRPAANSPKGFPIEAAAKLGHFYLNSIDKKESAAAGTYFNYPGKTLSSIIFAGGLDGKDGDAFPIFTGDEIVELEPGILVLAYLEQIHDSKKSPEREKLLKEKATYILLYKKEKEQKALAMSSVDVWNKLDAFYTPYRKAFKQVETGNVAMVKPIPAFKDQPSNTILVQASQQRMNETNWKEELLYVYPSVAWTNKFENIGIMGRTLTHRVMQVQAVLKDATGQCKITQFFIRQENTYTAGSNAEKFAGNPIKAIADSDKTDINCTKAMQYKK